MKRSIADVGRVREPEVLAAAPRRAARSRLA